MLVAITQPSIPHYRLPLFDMVVARLRDVGHAARIFYSADSTVRSDSQVNARAWAQPVSATRTSFRGRISTFRPLPPPWNRSAVLVTELEAGNVNAWQRYIHDRPYLLLGHGKGYTAKESRLSIKLESALCKRAAHVLTYMPSGQAEVLRRTGLPGDRVTSFQNSTDTRAKRSGHLRVLPVDVEEARRKWGIGPGQSKVAAYVGALEPYKRVDVIVEAARIALNMDTSTHLFIAGQGSDEHLVQRLLLETGRVTLLPSLDVRGWSLLGHIAKFLLVPGRIGLIATDALAVGLPILTTSYPWHAPEVEYLREGETLLTVEGRDLEIAHEWSTRNWDSMRGMHQMPTVEASALVICDQICAALDGQAREAT